MGIFKRGNSDDRPERPWRETQENSEPAMTTASDVRRRRPPEGEAVAENLGVLMERVSLSSVQEIDRLIAELEALKSRLQYEADRVQREVVDFTSLSQTAMQSTKVIAESLTHWRSVQVSDAPAVGD